MNSGRDALKKSQCLFQNLLGGQLIGVDVEIRVLTGVVQSLYQFLPPIRRRGGGPTLRGDFPGDIQVDKYVGLSDQLPHRGHVGVLLGDFAGVVSPRSQRLHEQRFARGARADNGDQLLFLSFHLFHQFGAFSPEERWTMVHRKLRKPVSVWL